MQVDNIYNQGCIVLDVKKKRIKILTDFVYEYFTILRCDLVEFMLLCYIVKGCWKFHDDGNVMHLSQLMYIKQLDVVFDGCHLINCKRHLKRYFLIFKLSQLIKIGGIPLCFRLI